MSTSVCRTPGFHLFKHADLLRSRHNLNLSKTLLGIIGVRDQFSPAENKNGCIQSGGQTKRFGVGWGLD